MCLPPFSRRHFHIAFEVVADVQQPGWSDLKMRRGAVVEASGAFAQAGFARGPDINPRQARFRIDPPFERLGRQIHFGKAEAQLCG